MTAKTHYLKTWPEYFEEVSALTKTFEVRKNDRDYEAGDLLVLQEWSAEKGYTGKTLLRHVRYVLKGGEFGIEDGYVVMSIAED